MEKTIENILISEKMRIEDQIDISKLDWEYIWQKNYQKDRKKGSKSKDKSKKKKKNKKVEN